MGCVHTDGCDLYYEEAGDGVPILLIHPSGATASTWGAAVAELARIGRVIVDDRRGYARSGGAPVRTMSVHTDDAAAILEHLEAAPAVVVGTSAGAGTAADLAVRRPDVVRAVVASAIPTATVRRLDGAGHAAPFDATATFVRLIAEIADAVAGSARPDGAEGVTVTAGRLGGSARGAWCEG